MSLVLIIEDEAAIADTLVFALQAEGFATQADFGAQLRRCPTSVPVLTYWTCW
jgi:DNA-binding response OmpR family regulator